MAFNLTWRRQTPLTLRRCAGHRLRVLFPHCFTTRNCCFILFAVITDSCNLLYILWAQLMFNHCWVAKQPRYVELKGDASSMHPRNVWRISQGLRGQAPIKFANDPCCRVRHAEPESPIHVLSECGDARCGAHRLNYPEVRQRFRTFITRTIRKSKKDPGAPLGFHQRAPQNSVFKRV